MSVTPEEVRYVAQLARLSFRPEEERRLAGELSAITDYMRQLEEVDVSEVPPMDHVLDRVDVFRKDSVQARIGKEAALKNAPDTDGQYFRVPKVIE